MDRLPAEGRRGKSTMNRSLTIVGALVLAGLAACSRSETGLASPAPRPAFGGDFTLTNQDGQPFRLASLGGRPAVLFFGYTSCPDMCPATMSRIVAALNRVERRRDDVAILFVSVDPKRDTPAVLKEYVKSFSRTPIGLTGTEDDINRVSAQYHAAASMVPTGTTNYLVNHTSAMFVIDRQGKLRQYFKYDERPEAIAATIQTVVDEKP